MEKSVCVIGLGYVGLPVAYNFAKKYRTIGIDISKKRVEELRNHQDSTREITTDELKALEMNFSTNIEDASDYNFFIVTVPTPIDSFKTPDLTPVISATQAVAKVLKKGDTVVYESTVYPGVTEDICAKILEEKTGLKFGIDFFLGYSPERINPGDKEHTFTKITKVVSGCCSDSLKEIASMYASVIEADVFKATSIKVAEASKVIENIQRDVNIGLINELALIFDKMDINTSEVLEASGTKWNFLNFKPGLVGGHCIGVDPYYLSYKSKQLGIIPQIINAGRRVNDSIATHVSQKAIKLLIQNNVNVKGANIAVLGLTFKENCPDLRNSKVEDIIRELNEYATNTILVDPHCNQEEVLMKYDKKIQEFNKLRDIDLLLINVAHREFLNLSEEDLVKVFSGKPPIIVDVKNICPNTIKTNTEYTYWSL
ncbi:putative udp-glucose 6-dehydrogenase [Halobacteriovorax sp. BALOs_7]|uniref:nucleotide sugar dehydrogenase n=1 Tax=Halobacteriovorax sp. BALOs_7 TaxID=2109558 RepID=UPI000EA0105B|nr:nucleotide sugar dehydrogenase [Halobacteriovorax sp. BALOs_7]AYF43810.1 putative udp-glucose 6-dehydrogenase [Halobacteriovorax sp. BALOs_7]